MENQPKRRGRPRKNPIQEIIVEDRLKVYIHPKMTHGEPGGIPRVVEGQIKFLPQFGIDIVEKEEDADVLVCHVTVPDAFVKRFPMKPLVVINHGLYWGEIDWNGKWHEKVNSDAMEGIRIADRVITCSNWVANSIRRHTSRVVDVIPHGVEANLWEYKPEENLGYVLWNKTRPDPVCDPAPVNHVATWLPDVQFVSTFGKEAPNIKLTGRQPFEVAKGLIERAGIYLCTTRETFGIGTLEALAAGVPVVAWNYGGQAEFMVHQKHGWLAQPGDIRGLVDGIKWCLENRTKLSQECRNLAEEYNWTKAAEAYAKLFRDAHTSKHAPGPRVSVVVTNYQLHEFLPKCLESVSAQSNGDFECIIVDDASPDASGRHIAREFSERDQRFRLITNEKNVYLAEARNIGIRNARGRYILPLDADDMLSPNTIATLGDALDRDKSIHIVYGGVFFVDEDGVTPTDYSAYFGVKIEPGRSQWPFPFKFEQQIQQRNLLPYCSMFRKEVWEQVGGYRRRCRTAEDADFWTRISSYGFRPKMVTTSDTLIYRNRLSSMSRKEGDTDWIRWFSWSKVKELCPAGAVTVEQLPISSLDPILISVIIPVGPGHEKYVHDAIDSVAAQSFQNWECIVIDDSGGCLPELPTWVRTMRTDGKGSGPAHARNVGIRASQGTCFLPLDADDFLEPDALQFMWEAYQKTKDVIYSDFWYIDNQGKETKRHYCDDYDPFLVAGKKRKVGDETREGMIHTVTALTPKKHWEAVGGYDESLPAWEDWDFQLSLADIGVCETRVPYPLFTYRMHTGMRREQNFSSFDISKEAILRKWSKLWEGGKQLMACGSCSSRKSVQPSSSMMTMNAQRIRPSSETVIVKYNGPKQGSIGYRGASKTMYFFAKGDTRLVLREDVGTFQGRADFEIIERGQEQEPQQVTAPVLTAVGSPNS